MDNFELLFKLQELYDEQTKIDSFKTEKEKIIESFDKSYSRVINPLKDKYNNELRVPKFMINVNQNSDITEEGIEDTKNDLIDSFINFEKKCKKLSSDFYDEVQKSEIALVEKKSQSIKQLEKEFHAAVDKINSNDLISKKHVYLIPEITTIIGEGRAETLTDAINLAIKEKKDEEFIKEKLEIERQKLEELQRKNYLDEEHQRQMEEYAEQQTEAGEEQARYAREQAQQMELDRIRAEEEEQNRKWEEEERQEKLDQAAREYEIASADYSRTGSLFDKKRMDHAFTELQKYK